MKTGSEMDSFETTAMVSDGRNSQIMDADREQQSLKVNDTRDDITENTRYKTKMIPDLSVRQIWFNLIIFSCSFLLLFSAFLSFENLQSSVNQSEGLGTVGIAVIYISMVVTLVFLPPLTMSRFSLKWIAVVSMVAHLCYIATGYYPSWFTIIPASTVVGIGSAHLWIVNAAFITQLARRYAAKTNEEVRHVTSHFFGVFFVALVSYNIWGNLISSLVLHVDITNSSSTVDNGTQCGADFCSFENNSESIIAQPTKGQYYLFTSICMALGLAATACLVLFMKYIPPEGGQDRVDITSNLKKVLAHLLTDHRQHLLILPTFYRGMMQAFIAGDFTIAFVSCPLGVDNVGFVMVTFGVTGAIMSYTVGKVSKYTGLYPLFCLAFGIHTAVCITMLVWKPDSSTPSVIYVLAGLWSVGDCIYLTLVAVIYSVYFEDKLETALSCFRLLDAIGLAVTFGYSAFLCTHFKLYIVQAVLLASQICITVFFVRMRKSGSGSKGDLKNPASI